MCWYRGQAGAKPGHNVGGYGKWVRRAEGGPGASESVEGDPWLVSMHYNERKGAEGQEQGAAVTVAPEGAEEERPEQQLGNN